MSITTPTTWPEAVRPTPEQFVRWYEACTATERLEVMTRLLEDSGTASSCFQQNHDALMHEVQRMQGDYQRGYQAALDTLLAMVDEPPK